MRKAFFIIMAGGLLAVACVSGQKNAYTLLNEREVPERYVKDFSRLRPQAVAPAWRQVDSTTYAVQFSENNNDIEMHFSATGVETFWQIPLQYTPNNIMEYVKKEYPGYKITEVKITDIRNQKGYQAVVAKKKEIQRLNFDLGGNFQKVVK